MKNEEEEIFKKYLGSLGVFECIENNLERNWLLGIW